MNTTRIKITYRDGRVVRETRSEWDCVKLTNTFNATAYDYHVTDVKVEWDDDESDCDN